MAEGGRTPLYLARASYRRRRLIDGQRLLSIVMFCLFLLPLVWGGATTGRPVGAGVQSFIHIFVVWIAGIVVAAFIARKLMRTDVHEDELEKDTQLPPLPQRDEAPPSEQSQEGA